LRGQLSRRFKDADEFKDEKIKPTRRLYVHFMEKSMVDEGTRKAWECYDRHQVTKTNSSVRAEQRQRKLGLTTGHL
jgi:hypothetical protein